MIIALLRLFAEVWTFSSTVLPIYSFHHPLPLNPSTGSGFRIARDTEVAESWIFSGESGDADSPEVFAALDSRGTLERKIILSVGVFRQTKYDCSVPSVSGESNSFYALHNMAS
ncbi:MAG: hypothetical protein V1758_02050 [Pseudomonadota bacterium]